METKLKSHPCFEDFLSSLEFLILLVVCVHDEEGALSRRYNEFRLLLSVLC